MPQPHAHLSQRGSTLIGVVGLSLVLTLASAGYMALVANDSQRIDVNNDDRFLHYAAVSGLMMGARWVKNYTHSIYVAKGMSWTGMTISQAGYTLNGYNVTVSIEGFADSTWRSIKSVANKGSGTNQETDTWRFQYPPPANALDASQIDIDSVTYQETFLAKAP